MWESEVYEVVREVEAELEAEAMAGNVPRFITRRKEERIRRGLDVQEQNRQVKELEGLFVQLRNTTDPTLLAQLGETFCWRYGQYAKNNSMVRTIFAPRHQAICVEKRHLLKR